MLTPPGILTADARHTAAIRLTIPRTEIHRVMGPAIAEVLAAVEAQGQRPAGPVFSHHFRMAPDTFDFEVGVPVARPLSPGGRVHPARLGGMPVVRAIHQGPYDGLAGAWRELGAWIAAQGLQPDTGLWESYLSGPESGRDPSTWQTELNQPLAPAAAR